LIDFSLRHRLLVIVLALCCAIAGAVSLQYLDIDAFPDTTPVQVQINTTAPELGPEEVEQQVTFPIEQVIGGMPGVKRQGGVRSISKFGLSQVVVTFEDGTNIYFARQLMSERLTAVKLPLGIEQPKLGPVSTGLGEVFHYLVTRRGTDVSKLPEDERIRQLTDLRTIHDWTIKPKLRTVRGTAEVNSWGGYEKQYQVRIDPARLIKHSLTFGQVLEAVEKNNRNVGGGSIRQNTEMLLVHGIGRTINAEQIGNIVVAAKGGVPLRVRDVADVVIGNKIRRGAVTAKGKG
jgi:cobalt-zinc-cadmium resistance protein CzcA